jgi:hypothetical protein
MLHYLNTSKKFPVIIDSIQLHNVTIIWVDTSVYDQRYNFDCGQAITVLLNKQENNREFYVIMYEWLYDRNIPDNHPFCYDQILKMSTSSVVRLWRTPESDSLVKYLVMNNNELAKYCGSMTTERFRRDIIIALELFGEEGGKIIESGAVWENQLRFRIYPGDGQDPPGLGGHGWIVKP